MINTALASAIIKNLAMEILIEETEMKEKGFTLGSLLEAEGLAEAAGGKGDCVQTGSA